MINYAIRATNAPVGYQRHSLRSVLTRNVIEYFEVPGIIFRDYTRDSRKIRLCVLHIEEGSVCVLNSNNARGQETPAGNQRGERRRASSPKRRGQRQTRVSSPGQEAIALGISLVGPKPHAANSHGVTAIESLSEICLLYTSPSPRD